MFEVNINYEGLEKVLEEAKKDISGDKKIALIRNDIILAIFELDTYITDIECKGWEIARKTLNPKDIDLYLIIIEKNNIIQKDILIQKDIVKEEEENYQVINGNIYELDEKETEEEIYKYSEDVFSDVLYRSDAYFELEYNSDIYNNCVYYIFEQMKRLYNEGYTIYTSDNSFIMRGTQRNMMSTDFENHKIVLNKNTKKAIVKAVEDSNLSKVAKKEVISRVKNY